VRGCSAADAAEMAAETIKSNRGQKITQLNACSRPFYDGFYILLTAETTADNGWTQPLNFYYVENIFFWLSNIGPDESAVWQGLHPCVLEASEA